MKRQRRPLIAVACIILVLAAATAFADCSKGGLTSLFLQSCGPGRKTEEAFADADATQAPATATPSTIGPGEADGVPAPLLDASCIASRASPALFEGGRTSNPPLPPDVLARYNKTNTKRMTLAELIAARNTDGMRIAPCTDAPSCSAAQAAAPGAAMQYLDSSDGASVEFLNAREKGDVAAAAFTWQLQAKPEAPSATAVSPSPTI